VSAKPEAPHSVREQDREVHVFQEEINELGAQEPAGHDQSDLAAAIQPANSGVMRVITLGYSPLRSSTHASAVQTKWE
jgi:hypothetical protein